MSNLVSTTVAFVKSSVGNRMNLVSPIDRTPEQTCLHDLVRNLGVDVTGVWVHDRQLDLGRQVVDANRDHLE